MPANERKARVRAGADAGQGRHCAGPADEVDVTLRVKGLDNADSPAGRHLPDLTDNHVSRACRGRTWTDALEANVCAETDRHRNDFTADVISDHLAAYLALLTAHCTDPTADCVRGISCLCDLLTGAFPTDSNCRPQEWLAYGGEHGADAVAVILAPDARFKERMDKPVREMFHGYPQAAIIESMQGMAPIAGAEFVVTDVLPAYTGAEHLASPGGVVPTAPDSGRTVIDVHRPKRCSRRLRWIFRMFAHTSSVRAVPNREGLRLTSRRGCFVFGGSGVRPVAGAAEAELLGGADWVAAVLDWDRGGGRMGIRSRRVRAWEPGGTEVMGETTTAAKQGRWGLAEGVAEVAEGLSTSKSGDHFVVVG